MIERQPPYWWASRSFYHLNYGDPGTPAGQAELRRISPLHELERIRTPLLIVHGRNDIRVPIQDSDEVHAGLQKQGRISHYVVFEDEGHSIRSIPNRLASWRNADAFLKRCVQ
jgi:dipeptidyl aminopeptidase/acylaminoacyl peptidase